jgi:hypothetical protein
MANCAIARLQVPMSKMESDEHLNDRYKAIEDRLAVSEEHIHVHGPSGAIVSCP